MKKRGRRPIDPTDCSVQVGLVLPGRQYDEYRRSARVADISVSEVIRRELAALKKYRNNRVLG